MIRNFGDFLRNHLDFCFYHVTYLAFAVAMLIIPSVMYLPEPFGYENGVLENIQLFFLFLTGFFALRAKEDKKFFVFVALVVVILLLREVNCGRTIFFAIPGEVNAFYSWKQIKYGWLAHPLYAMYMIGVGIYFLKNKLYLNLWKKFSKIKLPLWNILLMLLGMVLGTYAEEVAHNFILEEITELLFYVSLCGIVYLYSNDKKYMPAEIQ